MAYLVGTISMAEMIRMRIKYDFRKRLLEISQHQDKRDYYHMRLEMALHKHDEGNFIYGANGTRIRSRHWALAFKGLKGKDIIL